MSTRRGAAQLEALVIRFARIPPFITAPLALAAYVLFNQITRIALSLPVDAAPDAGATVLQDAVFWTMLKGFAHVLQYLVPLILLLSVVLWFARYFQAQGDRRVYEKVASSPVHGALHEMSWQQFERLVGEAFRSLGYAVTHTGRAGPDGGIDLILKRGSEVSLVQCKHWKANRVSVDKVRELFGLMAERGAAGGFVVSAGNFTSDAARFAYGKNITLITGEQLHRLIRTGTFGDAVVVTPVERVFLDFDGASCPDCGSPMAERMARKGRYIGQTFLGCTRYPDCNGIRHAERAGDAKP